MGAKFKNVVFKRHNRLSRALRVLFAVTAASATIHAVAKPPPQAWTITPLLNGRLSVQAPSTASLLAMDHNLMAPETPQDAFQRVMMQVGATKLVVLVAELYARSDRPLCTVATEYIAPDKRFPKVQCEQAPLDKSPLSVALLSPAKPAPFGSIVLLDIAMVRQADGTLQQLTFFIDAVRPADMQAVKDTVRRFIGSIAPGQRTLKSGQGVTALHGRLVFDLPANFAIKEEKGDDFDVTSIVQLGEPASFQNQLIVYLGHHPRPPSAPDGARRSQLTVFERDTTWCEWDNALIIQGEGYVTAFGPEQSDTAHVFLAADGRESTAKLLGILTTARYQDQVENAAKSRADGTRKE
jgi:hypothetical protein